MQNLGDVKEAVRARGYETDTDSEQTVFANDIQRDICNETRWRFMLESATVAAVAGTASYALPTNPPIHLLESIRLAQPNVPYIELTHTDSDDFLELQGYGTSYAAYSALDASDAQLWSVVTEGSFSVYPTPAAAGTFTVRYLRPPTDLEDDADVPDIPAEYLDVLVEGMVMNMAARERQWDAYDRAQARYDKRLAKMKAQYALKQRQSSARVEYSGQRDYYTA
jgi:hypothetical protein